MTYDERHVYSDSEGCQHGTEVYRHEPYKHYCMDCGADLDELMDLAGLQADLDELESADAIVKAAAISYANMVARVTGAPDAELSEHEKLTRALEAAQDEIRALRYQHAAIHETLEATHRDAWAMLDGRQDALQAAQDEIERLTRQRDDARRIAVTAGAFQPDCDCVFTIHESGICQALTDDEMAAAGVVTDHTVGCDGDRCGTCEAIRSSTCPPCSTGDHSGHRAELAGVCVGCACEGAS